MLHFSGKREKEKKRKKQVQCSRYHTFINISCCRGRSATQKSLKQPGLFDCRAFFFLAFIATANMQRTCTPRWGGLQLNSSAPGRACHKYVLLITQRSSGTRNRSLKNYLPAPTSLPAPGPRVRSAQILSAPKYLYGSNRRKATGTDTTTTERHFPPNVLDYRVFTGVPHKNKKLRAGPTIDCCGTQGAIISVSRCL